MSILSEYEDIKKALGEETAIKLECYLSFHPHMLLSELYYRKDAFDEAIDWWERTPDFIKKNAPLYLVVENYKGTCEHNFFGTKKEVLSDLGMIESEFDKLFYHMDMNDPEGLPIKEEVPLFYKRANLTYEIHVATSMEDVIGFFEGQFNNKEDNKENPDWYYSLHESRCGREGFDILSKYKEENVVLSILTRELFVEFKNEQTEGKVTLNYDEYLNHKPIAKCTSKRDMKQHDDDNDKMFTLLDESGASAALITAKHMDVAHKGEVSYHYVSQEGFREHLDSYDQKNGIDLVIHDGKFGAVIYGQNYTTGKEKTKGMEEVLVTYQLFDDKKIDQLNLIEELDNTHNKEDAQKILSCMASEDVFLEDTKLKDALRNVKRLPLDIQIKESEKIKKEQQEKRRGKGSKDRHTSNRKERK